MEKLNKCIIENLFFFFCMGQKVTNVDDLVLVDEVPWFMLFANEIV